MRRRCLLLTLALLALPASAHAAPPSTGAAPPARTALTQIGSDYVGPAVVGPMSQCVPQEPDGNGVRATLCVDVTVRYCQRWVKRIGVWRRDGYVSNMTGGIVWVAPYAGGYHWTWNFGGYRAVATACLYRYAPTYS